MSSTSAPRTRPMPTSRWPRSRPASTSSARSRWPRLSPMRAPLVAARAASGAWSQRCPSSTATTRWSARPGPASPRGEVGGLLSVHRGYLQDWLLRPETTTGGRARPRAGRRGRSPTSARTCATSSSSSPASASPVSRRGPGRVYDERGGRRSRPTRTWRLCCSRLDGGALGTAARLADGARPEERADPRAARHVPKPPLRPGAAGRAVGGRARGVAAHAARPGRRLARLGARCSPCPPVTRWATRTPSTPSSPMRTPPSRWAAPMGSPCSRDGLRAAVLTDAVLASAAAGLMGGGRRMTDISLADAPVPGLGRRGAEGHRNRQELLRRARAARRRLRHPPR